MERHEVEEVARHAAEEAVSQALVKFTGKVQDAADKGVTAALERVGISADNPTETQQDMAFLRDWRTTTAAIRRKGIMTAVGIIVAAALGALWLGFKALTDS